MSRTLAGAAKHLQVTQSIVSRRIAAMQEGMGMHLLQRTTDSYMPTGPVVDSIRQHVETEIRLVEVAGAGLDIRLAGTVQVSSSQLFVSYLFVPRFAAFCAQHRDILN